MSIVAALRRTLGSAARKAVDRIRRGLPGELGRHRWSDDGGHHRDDVSPDPRRPPATPGSLTRQSAVRRSSTALEDPAMFDDGGDDTGNDRPDVAGPSSHVAADPDPLDGLARRDRPLPDPADGDANDTMTEGERRADGRVRIADPEDPEAYLEADVSVSLDHLR